MAADEVTVTASLETKAVLEDWNDDETITDGSADLGDSDGAEWDSDREDDATDAQQQLGELYGQLQALSLELDAVRPPERVMPAPLLHGNGVKARPKPTVPPKPPMDTQRYSKANLEDSAEADLDALIGELCALESQLSAATSNAEAMGHLAGEQRRAVAGSSNKAVHFVEQSSAVTAAIVSPTHRPTPAALPLTDGASRLAGRGQLANNHEHSGGALAVVQGSQHQQLPSSGLRAGSPDADSAFGDGSSLVSAASTHRSRDSNASSSTDSSRGSLNTPSPTQQVDAHAAPLLRTVAEGRELDVTSPQTDGAGAKAQKIKLALEKMKEASIKKLYVKFFMADGGAKSLLVDERSTVAHVLRQLSDKQRSQLSISHAIVESYPDLFMERIYEDHEYLVENMLLWTRDSANKLHFVERGEKYRLFCDPQAFLVADTSADRRARMDASRRQQLIEEFFAPSIVQPPEIEGYLSLKADGKKAWKRHYFVLRASGLYYIPKGKSKSSQDLVCLTSLEMVQVYQSVGWKQKYKAPTEFGFALKHPQIQMKASKYIKYLCADDEAQYQRWLAGLRIAKCGRQLYENYELMRAYLETDEARDSATASLRSSASAENCYPSPPNSQTDAHDGYCRDSVIMRPRSVVSHDFAEVKLRPRSADIGIRGSSGSGGGQKRNSRSLAVDLPTIPADPQESFYAAQYQQEHAELPGSHENFHQQQAAVQQNGHYHQYYPQTAATTVVPRRHDRQQSDEQAEMVEQSYLGQQASIYAPPPPPSLVVVARGSGSQTPTSSVDSTSLSAFDNDGSATGTIKRQPSDLRPALQPAPAPVRPAVLVQHRRRTSENERDVSMASSSGAGYDVSRASSSCVDSSGYGGEADSDEEEDFPPPPPPLSAAVVHLAQQQPSATATAPGQLFHKHGQLVYAPVTAEIQPGGGGGGRKRVPPPPPPPRADSTRLSDERPVVAAKPSNKPQGADFHSELAVAMQKRLQKLQDGSQREADGGGVR